MTYYNMEKLQVQYYIDNVLCLLILQLVNSNWWTNTVAVKPVHINLLIQTLWCNHVHSTWIATQLLQSYFHVFAEINKKTPAADF